MQEHWNVLKTRSGYEISFAERLGSWAFTPKIRKTWIAHGKEYERDMACYVGIVFVRGDMGDPYLREYIADIPGYQGIIPGAPLSVAAMALERAKFDAGGYYHEDNSEPLPNIPRPGTKLRIIDGPFANATGICIWSNKNFTNLRLTPCIGLLECLSMQTKSVVVVHNPKTTQQPAGQRQNRNRFRRSPKAA